MDKRSLRKSFGSIRKSSNRFFWVSIIILLLIIGLLLKRSDIIWAIIALVLFNYTYETHKMQKETADRRRLESTPFVCVLLERRPYKFLVTNIGQAAAIKIDVKILKPPIKEVYSSIEEVLVSFKTVEVLAKGEEKELKIESMNDPDVSSFTAGSILDSAYIQDLIKRSQLYGLHFDLKFKNILSESYHSEFSFQQDEFTIKDFRKA